MCKLKCFLFFFRLCLKRKQTKKKDDCETDQWGCSKLVLTSPLRNLFTSRQLWVQVWTHTTHLRSDHSHHLQTATCGLCQCRKYSDSLKKSHFCELFSLERLYKLCETQVVKRSELFGPSCKFTLNVTHEVVSFLVKRVRFRLSCQHLTAVWTHLFERSQLFINGKTGKILQLHEKVTEKIYFLVAHGEILQTPLRNRLILWVLELMKNFSLCGTRSMKMCESGVRWQT